MKKQLICYITTTLVLILQVTSRHVLEMQNLEEQDARKCRNYFGTLGICISRRLCTRLPGIDLVQRGWTYWDYLIMDGHYCGGRGDFDLVCCDKSNVKKSVKTRFGTKKPEIESLLPIPGEGNKCGFVVSNKIARQGTRTSIEEFPWMALLQYSVKSHPSKLESFCTGVLISERYVLTTAHCLANLENYNVVLKNVRLGDWNISTSNDCFVQGITKECSEPTQDIPVENVVIHPEYLRTGHVESDIALIRLAHPARFSIYVKPICLPMFNEDIQNGVSSKRFITAGWRDGSYETKRTTEIHGTDKSNCDQVYGIVTDESTSICASVGPEKDFLDNGGALMATHNNGQGNNYFYAAGLASVRPETKQHKKVAKNFIRVSPFVEWIQENVEA